MAGWRATQDYLQSTTLRPNGKLVRTNPSSKRTLESRIHWFDNVLERAPEQMWPAVAHPRILDALGAIVGRRRRGRQSPTTVYRRFDGVEGLQNHASPAPPTRPLSRRST